LNCAHDSLIDAKAQTDIFIHKYFGPFIDQKHTVQQIDAIFTATQQNEWKKTMEPDRPVHHPWVEQTASTNFEWSPPKRDSYTGPHGGPSFGPTQFMKDIVRSADNLALIFLAILSVSFFVKVALLTSKYCYKDWVVEKERHNEHGNVKKKKYLVDVYPTTGGEPTPNVAVRWDINPGCIICWIGILILQGGHFRSEKRSARKMWQWSHYGLSIPYVRNSMRRDAFEFLRRHIHFAENDQRKNKGEPGYDPLFKVRYVLDKIGKGLIKVWQAGKNLSLDKSMIKYCGRAVAFVQYMPAKPIKHGIKVFCLCCAYSAIMLSFEVYCGKDSNKTDNMTAGICERLIHAADLVTGATGMIWG
jgi:hypothetical protein